MKLTIALVLAVWPIAATAQDTLRVAAPLDLAKSGLLQHILPRFALKHGLRARLVDSAGDATFGAGGIAVFQGLGQVWHLDPGSSEAGETLAAWLRSDIGKRAVESFAPTGTAPFIATTPPPAATAEIPRAGDPAAGERLSLALCGRCHVINETNKMKGMGATPSFAMLRTLPDWENRFTAFFALNPHPSFTQVEDITPPFDISRPPAIVPITVTQDEIAAITAYVANIPPANLGAPIQSR